MSKDIAFILYNTPEYSEKVQVVIKDETLWMTQKAMSELFGVDKSSISRHLKNIFESGELDEKVVVAKIETTTQHGAMAGKTQTNETNFYNLDAIISVGYRVNSMQQFAQSVNEFLSFRRYNILPDKGRVSRAIAEEKAEREYDIYNKMQIIDSDFDKAVKNVLSSEHSN